MEKKELDLSFQTLFPIFTPRSLYCGRIFSLWRVIFALVSISVSLLLLCGGNYKGIRYWLIDQKNIWRYTATLYLWLDNQHESLRQNSTLPQNSIEYYSIDEFGESISRFFLPIQIVWAFFWLAMGTTTLMYDCVFDKFIYKYVCMQFGPLFSMTTEY